MARKIVAMMMAVMMAAALLAGCSGGAGQPSGEAEAPGAAGEGQPETQSGSDGPVTVVLVQPSDPSTLDPHKTSGDQGANVWRNICESLTTYDAADQLVPALAISWEQTAPTQWVFHLVEGATFSNGEPFNAEAVGWNLDRGNSEEYARQNMTYRTVYETGSWEALDEHTIQVTTTVPAPIFDRFMCDLPMIAPAYSEEIGEDAIGSDPVGTGPYMLESWAADQQIVLVQNPAYRDTAPQVERYVIRCIPEAATRIAELINGNVDILYDVSYENIDMLEGQGNVAVENKVTRRIEYIAYNTTEWTPNPELQDVRVRQALNYAIDRQAIIENIMGGFSTQVASIWRDDFQDYDPGIEGYSYDPGKAMELLAEAGYADGFDITLMTTDGNHAKATEVCEAVAAYLKAVNVNCTVEVYDDATSRSIIINGQDQKLTPGMFDWNWASKPFLSDTWLTGIVHSTGMSSYNCIEGYDEIVDSILALDVLEDRTPLYQELQQMLIDNPPYLYLFQLGSIYATNTRLDWSAAGTQFILAQEMTVR